MLVFSETSKRTPQHKLVGGTLKNEPEGIIARCVCGWSSGHRISSFAASAAMMAHKEKPDED